MRTLSDTGRTNDLPSFPAVNLCKGTGIMPAMKTDHVWMLFICRLLHDQSVSHGASTTTYIWRRCWPESGPYTKPCVERHGHETRCEPPRKQKDCDMVHDKVETERQR
jgi:hypothetical protein